MQRESVVEVSVCVACCVYLRLSEPERLGIQAGMFENFLGGFLRWDRLFDQLRAQNFVSGLEAHKYNNTVYVVCV